MPDPVEFPLPPDDVRFLSRVERSRSPPRPPPQSRDPPARSPASGAAERLLRGYMTRRPAPRPRPRNTRPSSNRFVALASLMVAAALIAPGLIYFLTCRPDLRGRRLRARLISPGDVKRVVFLRTLPAATLLNHLRL